MNITLKDFSYRFAEEVLNSKLSLKQEIKRVILECSTELPNLSRPKFNEIINQKLSACGWESQPAVFDAEGDPAAKMDFLKERVGVEVEFGHASFIGIDLLKFQVASYSGINKIDSGIYIVTTKRFQAIMEQTYHQTWKGSLNYEKVTKYLPHFRSAIQLPIYVLGIDLES